MNTINYAYDNIGNGYSSGKLVLHQRPISRYGGRSIMTLDIARKKITIWKGLEVDEKEEKQFLEIDNIITVDVKYCLAVHVFRGSRAKLMDFIIQ